ncbi:unnamed protein product [Phytomonas sp. EM1]|nr:unnamed protein product [Phytomonas sp. EM1]|eukprot:CCW65784.1 unnamed protein product [Phytomonas sp. isolate EM1]
MPVVSTPFVLELRPPEEFVLSRTGESLSQSTTRNNFSAAVNSIIITEEPYEGHPDVIKPGKTKPQKQSKLSEAPVCVSLVANIDHLSSNVAAVVSLAEAAIAEESTSNCITLASYIFNSNLEAIKSETRGARSEGNPATASQDANASRSSASASCSPLGFDVYHLTLKRPLLFNSDTGNVRSLRVKASAMGELESTNNYGENDSNRTKASKSYHGPRRFVVRLIGIQQTVLTDAQVALFSS